MLADAEGRENPLSASRLDGYLRCAANSVLVSTVLFHELSPPLVPAELICDLSAARKAPSSVR